MEEIKRTLGDSVVGQMLMDRWLEYEHQTSAEARLVKDLDKLEMIIQADEYEREQGKDLQGFFDSTRDKFTTTTGQAWAAALVDRRNERRSKK